MRITRAHQNLKHIWNKQPNWQAPHLTSVNKNWIGVTCNWSLHFILNFFGSIITGMRVLPKSRKEYRSIMLLTAGGDIQMKTPNKRQHKHTTRIYKYTYNLHKVKIQELNTTVTCNWPVGIAFLSDLIVYLTLLQSLDTVVVFLVFFIVYTFYNFYTMFLHFWDIFIQFYCIIN